MRQMIKILLSAFVGLLFAGASLVLFVPAAMADPFAQCGINKGCKPDNYEHTYCFGGSLAGDGLQSAAGYSMRNLVAQTIFSKTYMASCTGSTDVVFKRNDSMGSIRGRYTCLVPFGFSRMCGRARVELNSAALANMRNKYKTSCHEVGHSGGLVHGAPNDCMISGHVTSGHIHYNGHHVAHLNEQL